MPHCDKSEHNSSRDKGILASSERYIDVPVTKPLSLYSGQVDLSVLQYPEVVTAMPRSPESKHTMIVEHAADHVLWWVDVV